MLTKVGRQQELITQITWEIRKEIIALVNQVCQNTASPQPSRSVAHGRGTGLCHAGNLARQPGECELVSLMDTHGVQLQFNSGHRRPRRMLLKPVKNW